MGASHGFVRLGSFDGLVITIIVSLCSVGFAYLYSLLTLCASVPVMRSSDCGSELITISAHSRHLQEAEAQAQRTAFDQFIIAHRPTRRPGTHWEYLDIKYVRVYIGISLSSHSAASLFRSATTPADAEPVVFLPPGALRPEAFFDLLTRLSAKHRVMAVVFPADFSALADYVGTLTTLTSM